jgi:hypothetical protein
MSAGRFPVVRLQGGVVRPETLMRTTLGTGSELRNCVAAATADNLTALDRAQTVRTLMDHAFSGAKLERVVRFHHGAVGYVGNNVAALRWLDAYLGAYFDSRDRGSAEPLVVGWVDADLHSDLLAMLSGVKSIPSRTHSSCVAGPGRRWTWRASHHLRLTQDLAIHVLADSRSLIISDHDRERYAFVTASPDHDARFEPVRMIRELFTRQLEREGYTVLHAGAVKVDDQGVLICGPRGAGKTTLICGLLEHRRARFISNVRTFVRVNTAGVAELVTWPWSVRVGFGTCSSSERLRSYVESGGPFIHPQKDWDMMSGPEAVFAKHGGRPSDGDVIEAKLELTAAELAAIMGTSVESSARAQLLVFPELGSPTQRSRISQLELDEATELLKAQRNKVINDVHTDWLDLGLKSRCFEPRRSDECLQRLASACPAVRLSVRDGHDAARTLNNLLLAQ